MAKENFSLDFILKKDEIRNCVSEETKHNDLMSEKHKKVCRTLSYFEHFLNICFCAQWMFFNIRFCFIIRCFYRYYKFCSRISNFGINSNN